MYQTNHMKTSASFFLLIALLAVSLTATCSDSTTTIKSRNAFYIALGGKGNARSVNFERVFHTGSRVNYSYSVGYSRSGKEYSVPVSINAFTTGKQHHLEMSLAVIPYVAKHTFSKGTVDSDKQMYVKPSVGYRYQKTTTGLFIKAGVGPQIFLDPASSNVMKVQPKLLAPSAQLAIGINF